MTLVCIEVRPSRREAMALAKEKAALGLHWAVWQRDNGLWAGGIVKPANIREALASIPSDGHLLYFAPCCLTERPVSRQAAEHYLLHGPTPRGAFFRPPVVLLASSECFRHTA